MLSYEHSPTYQRDLRQAEDESFAAEMRAEIQREKEAKKEKGNKPRQCPDCGDLMTINEEWCPTCEVYACCGI